MPDAEGHSPDDDCPKTRLTSLIDGEEIVIHEPTEGRALPAGEPCVCGSGVPCRAVEHRPKPLECALCGMPRWNDESVKWSAGTSDGLPRLPYCADNGDPSCFDQANPATCRHEGHKTLCRDCADYDRMVRGSR